MQQIIYFFIRNKNFLLFLLLFLVAVGFTINSHSYHKTQYTSSANAISGSLYSVKSSITSYFNLKKQNKLLVEENSKLREALSNKGVKNNRSEYTVDENKYDVYLAKVINNSYSKSKNQLTIDKGTRDSIFIDMGVISQEGIVGIVSHTSTRYASVLSVLNTQSQIVAKFRKSNQFGTLKWDGKTLNTVQLIEIPRIANIQLGDTIVTDGKSAIFPPNIPVGIVSKFDIKENADYYTIDVQLFTDMTQVKHVYLIKNKDAKEIKQLEEEANNVEE